VVNDQGSTLWRTRASEHEHKRMKEEMNRTAT
jgi:hypothetical protein